MISIALATYNGERYIEKQLLSICNQTIKPDEIVICDDCSTDNTVNIVNEFSKRYVGIHWVIISNDKNLGFALNFKKAINSCSGDLIFLSDQDDIWENNKIEMMSNIMLSNSDIKLLFSKYKFIDSDDIVICGSKYVYNNSIIFNLLLLFKKIIKISTKEIIRTRNIPGMSMCIKKGIVKIYNKINDSDLYCHDSPLALIASLNDSLYLLNNTLVNYRIHNKNTMGVGNYTSEGKSGRLEWAKGKLNGVTKLKKCYSYIGIDKNVIKLFNDEIEFFKKRIEYLAHKKLPNVLFLLKYNGILGYLGDIKWILKEK